MISLSCYCCFPDGLKTKFMIPTNFTHWKGNIQLINQRQTLKVLKISYRSIRRTYIPPHGYYLGYLRTSLLKLGNIALFLLTNLHSNAAEEHTSGLQKLLSQLRPCTVAILKDSKIF